MTAILKMNVEDLDSSFVETMKREFAHSDLEIRVREQSGSADAFTVADFWQVIALLDWSNEGDDSKVVEPAVEFLQSCPLSHIIGLPIFYQSTCGI